MPQWLLDFRDPLGAEAKGHSLRRIRVAFNSMQL